MNINSDINIIGSLPDFNLINLFLNNSIQSLNNKGGHQSYTAIKTDKSVKRFEKAITNTLLGFKNKEAELLVKTILGTDTISSYSFLIIFWNASSNNELLHYLNEKIYFPAYYSGRISIKKDEAEACIEELKQTEKDIRNWSESTIEKTASKYLTLLKKFNLMEGSLNKSIAHPYLDDKMLIIFIYWLLAVETKPNLLESQWLKYCFMEKQTLVERLMQKKFAKFFNLHYTGDKLKIETIESYEKIYNAITQS